MASSQLRRVGGGRVECQRPAAIRYAPARGGSSGGGARPSDDDGGGDAREGHATRSSSDDSSASSGDDDDADDSPPPPHPRSRQGAALAVSFPLLWASPGVALRPALAKQRFFTITECEAALRADGRLVSKTTVFYALANLVVKQQR